MRVIEILSESKKIDELDINKVGTTVGKVAGKTAQGVGAVAGGIAGAGKAFMKGFRGGKSVVGGDDEEAGTTNPAAASAPAIGAATNAVAPKMGLTQLKRAVDTLRPRDRQSLLNYLQQTTQTRAPKIAPTGTAPAAQSVPASVTAKPAAQPKKAAPTKAVSV